MGMMHSTSGRVGFDASPNSDEGLSHEEFVRRMRALQDAASANGVDVDPKQHEASVAAPEANQESDTTQPTTSPEEDRTGGSTPNDVKLATEGVPDGTSPTFVAQSEDGVTS